KNMPRQRSSRRVREAGGLGEDLNSPTLRKKLTELGIKVPPTFSKATLLKLYKQNKDNGNDAAVNIVPDVTDKPREINGASASSTNDGEADITALPSTSSQSITQNQGGLLFEAINSLKDMVASQKTSSSRLLISDDNRPVDREESPDMSLGSRGVPMENIQNIDVISNSLRRSIIEGKTINIACLLVTNYEEQKTPSLVSNRDGTIQLKTITNVNDPKLKKFLTASEFATAFGRYKRIMCDIFPQRQYELDTYMNDILELYTKIGYKAYEYHEQFSAQAGSLWINKGIKVDWSRKDKELL
ncbi:unnamed protein product, partial [Owenia fusiformis]